MHAGMIASALLLFNQCSNAQDAQSAPGSVQHVDAAAFDQAMKAEPGQLVDVRTPDEYSEGHLEGAVNIDFYDEHFKENCSRLDKEKTVYVYCHSGGRSGKATDMLHEEGFKSVVDLSGGITGWKEAGMPVTR